MECKEITDIPVLYINLDHHTEKRNRVEATLKEYGFKNITRVPGVSANSPVIGCALAHVNALQKMKPPFIILEDDALLHFQDFFEVPKDADAVYLGVSTWGRENGKSGPFTKHTKAGVGVSRVYNMLSAHAILYLTEEYVEASIVATQKGADLDDFHDIYYAEDLQPNFTVYALDKPLFYQTSSTEATVHPLTN